MKLTNNQKRLIDAAREKLLNKYGLYFNRANAMAVLANMYIVRNEDSDNAPANEWKMP